MAGESIRTPDKSSKRVGRVIVGVVAIVALLIAAYLGTGLSTSVDEYSTTEVPFVGVGFSIALKNDGLFTQTKVVHCEVRTDDGVYNASREMTLGPGERTEFVMAVPIIGLDTDDVREKKCYTALL